MLLSGARFNATRPATRKTTGHMLHNMFDNAGKGHLKEGFLQVMEFTTVNMNSFNHVCLFDKIETISTGF